MPKMANVVSESGFRHAVPKGESDRPLFADDDDRLFYLDLLSKAQEQFDFVVIAYCLMNNHVHLLVVGDDFSDAMKYVGESYGIYFKRKAGLSGRTFRRPLWSEPVETEEHLLCTVRYIHANPEVARIADMFDYRWSSVGEYLGRQGVAHPEIILDMIGGVERFVEFSKSGATAVPFAGSKLKSHVTEDEALWVARQVVGERELTSMRGEARDVQCDILVRLRSAGLTLGQCARVTGLSRERAKYLLKDSRQTATP